jgi:Pyruvate/2-oxoacid:ferredoxin oxidoreductase delta subunit
VAFPEPTDPHAWDGWKEILEILYTPEEAALAAQLPLRPTRLEELSAQLALPADQLQVRLDAMCDKGIVMDIGGRRGSPRYLLSPPVVGFFEFSLMRAKDQIPQARLAAALEAYTHGDESFAREALGHATKIGRTLVHETALDDEPMPDVLDWERATHLVETATAWAVSLCYCRHAASHTGHACDAPQEVCLTLNGAVDFIVRRKFGRALSKEEALSIMQECRSKGLVQIADNVANHPTFICNCCGCCCEQLQGINRWGFVSVNPSGFLPRVEPENCAGCSRCSRNCPVGAITMVPTRTKRLRKTALLPKVDPTRCIGCGVCVDPCRHDARSMIRTARPRVPANPVEKAVRFALERGHLAALLVDGGDRFGTRFLRQVIDVLVRLPVARQILATEQVQSRFLKMVLKRGSARTRAAVAARRSREP